MVDFKTLFSRCKKERKLKSAAIAKHIGKSRSYVFSIEKGISKPPTYTICLQLSKLFKLSEKRRDEFLKSALIGRLGVDKFFYCSIHNIQY